MADPAKLGHRFQGSHYKEQFQATNNNKKISLVLKAVSFAGGNGRSNSIALSRKGTMIAPDSGLLKVPGADPDSDALSSRTGSPMRNHKGSPSRAGSMGGIKPISKQKSISSTFTPAALEEKVMPEPYSVEEDPDTTAYKV